MNCRVKIRIDGVLHDMDEFTEEEKKKIGERLNKQAMEAIGFKEVKEQKPA